MLLRNACRLRNAPGVRPPHRGECIKRRGETSSVEAGHHRPNASRDAIDGASSARTFLVASFSKWLKHDWMSSIAREQRCDIGSE